MSDVPPTGDLDSIAASLRADASDISVFFQVLASKLRDAMPAAVELEREGGLFRKDHPIKRIVVHAGEDVFEATLRNGAVACRHAHAIRGITLSSEDLELSPWLRELVGVLASQSHSSAEASAALRSLVT